MRIETIDASLPPCRPLVEGNIEAITRGDWHAYLNDEGKIISRPRQAPHARNRPYLADVFCGSLVFLGEGAHSEETDAPEYLIKLAEQLFDTALAA